LAIRHLDTVGESVTVADVLPPGTWATPPA